MSDKFDYKSVQYLRGVAALCVVGAHVGVQMERHGSDVILPQSLASGVDLFFVISGFIMWVTTRDAGLSPLDFYRRRLSRIVPLYWVFTSVIVLVALVLPSILQSAQFDLAHVVSSYLFLPFPNPADGTLTPILVPGWTLNYEMFFYALFGLSLFLPAGLRLWAMGATLVALVALGSLLSPAHPVLEFWTADIMLEFLFGMLIGAAVTGTPPLPGRILALGLIGLGIAALVAGDVFGWQLSRVIGFGLPATAIVLGSVSLDRIGAVGHWPLPRLIGDASYSIYLSHGLVLSALGQAWHRLLPSTGPLSVAAFAVLGLFVSTLAGHIVYIVLERPMSRVLHRRPKPALARA